MKDVSYEYPSEDNHCHRDGDGPAFNDALPAFLCLSRQYQLFDAEQEEVGEEDHQHIVVLDGLEKPAVQESMDKPLHPAT